MCKKDSYNERISVAQILLLPPKLVSRVTQRILIGLAPKERRDGRTENDLQSHLACLF